MRLQPHRQHSSFNRSDELTQFDAIPSEPESRKNHLPSATNTNQQCSIPCKISTDSQSEFRSKGREVADWSDADKVEEEDDEHSVGTTKVERALCQKSQSETRHHHL